ncbi:MAG TPA: GNAT family N-acetyltransferase [Thermoleophilaceae bacterium]|nr:GNAT family N-acetyltransferase [Thermoleophilaceae bacterium]
MADVSVRPVAAADEVAWRHLWDGYCTFYETDLPAEITDTTWKRLLDGGTRLFGLVAERDGEVIGLVNCVLHPSTWATADSCYLEDLFVSPDVRGAGAGRALIDAVLERAQERGWRNVYWHTRRDNERARALYDTYAPADDFVRYVVPPE